MSNQQVTSHVHTIFARLAAQNPEPKTELYYTNPYTLLVAVVLSAQATDLGVNRAVRPLFAKVDTPEAMLQLGEEALQQAVRTIGLYRTKSKHIIQLSRMLIEQHAGKVPASREALMKLPGVGRKTANVVLQCAFDQVTMPVDTHVFRVSHRLALAAHPTVLGTELELETLLRDVPIEWQKHAHHWLILHGRYVCTARRPKCTECMLRDLCPYPTG